MKIVFERSEYQLERLNELLLNYTEAVKLIDFITQWQRNESTFQFHTSGSTGVPKSIDVSRSQIVASVQATSDFLGLKNTHSALLCLDPNFVASLMMVARCLVNDMDLILSRPSSNPLNALDHSIDFASFVPVQVYKMIEEGSILQLTKIQNILIGGAPLSKLAFDTLAKIDTNIFITYGMTETVSHIALMPIKGDYSSAYFEVLPEITIGQDRDNCLTIVGAVTHNKTLQTNDIVELLDETKFRWLGRRDHVINSGGIKIHPEQLEKLIVPLINSDFFISWKTNDQLGNECILITENHKTTDEELKQIQAVIFNTFSKYHAPKSVYSVDLFERTDSGKVKREATRQKALGLL